MNTVKNILRNVTSFHYLLAVVFVFTTIFWRDWADLVSNWLVMDGAYSHGVLLILCSCWLLYLQRGAIEHTPVSVSIWGVIAFIGSLLLWASAQLLLINVVTLLVLPVILLTAILALLGWSVFFRSFIAIALIWFAVPVWDYLGSTLQHITVVAIQLPLTLFSIDFVINETFVELPGVGLFEVAFGCSGLRYFLIAGVLSVLIAELWFKSWQHKILVLAVGILLGLLSNWIRVAAIIYIGHESNMQSGLVEDHETFGWVLFAMIVSPAIWGAARWSERLDKLAPDSSDGTGSAEEVTKIGRLSGVSIVCFLLLSIIASLLSVYTGSKPHVNQLDTSLKAELGGWELLPVPLSGGLSTNMQSPDQIVKGSYFKTVANDIWRLNLSVYGYQYQRSGAELFGYGNHVFDSNRWQVVDQLNRVDNDSKNGWLIQELSQKYSPGATRHNYITSGYWVADRFFSSSLEARLAQIPAQLKGDRYTALVVIQLECSSCSAVDLDPAKYEAVLAGVIRSLNHI